MADASEAVAHSVEIRLAAQADIPAIARIANWAIERTWSNFHLEPLPASAYEAEWRAARDKHPWLVAVDEGAGVVGYAKASPWSGRCAYTWSVEVSVYVDPTRHRRGVGRALYSQLFEMLRAQGYRAAIGGIALPNEASVRLHEAMGMERTALFRRVGYKQGAWRDVGYWQIVLCDSDDPPEPILPVEAAAARVFTFHAPVAKRAR